MAINKYRGNTGRAASPSQAPAIPEPSFRSAIWIGAVALLAVLSILLFGSINGH